MNRLDATWARLAASHKKALVAYLCVGDPSLDESIELALACAASGADILELGVPFSDPSADGPAIARASQRAIAAGGGFDATLRVARAVRARSEVPIVLFGYYNPIAVRGEDAAAQAAADAGVDALLVVDLPVEELGPLGTAASERGLGVVPLLAPTSSAARVSAVLAAKARYRIPFAYYVSVTGVTGSTALLPGEASAGAARVREALGIPVVVGFGIDSGPKAQGAARGADGAVCGTAIVKLVESAGADRKAKVAALVAELRAALDQPG